MNSFGMTSGLSSNMEFTAKFQSVLAGTSFSPSFVGFGGKIVLPFDLPLNSHFAVWAEIVSNTNENTVALFPSKITRCALVMQPGFLRQINGNILFGISDMDHTQRMVAGGNASRIIGELVKVGGEFLYNYYDVADQQASMLILVRTHSNVCVQLSPGYLHSPAVSSWMISLGLSVSTAGIEFIQSEKSKDKKDEIPSIDELEKQLRDENKKDKEQ